jgi:signal transduction histidine kinase
VEVSDNGPGILLKNPDGVFDRFFTTKTEGFGIGLAICRDVIERQHGSIHARNNPDKGCCFWFSMPIGPPETRPDESA